jgi:ABC-2 type transport system ATP-binding protein
VIVTRDLTKNYDGVVGIKELNLTINDGLIFGLIGPNGAGKTTTLKMLSCLLKPTKGSATVNTLDITKDQKNIKKIVSYLPEEVGLYEEMGVMEYLLFFADLYNISRDRAKQMVARMAKRLDIRDRIDSKIYSLSKGMKRKVSLMRALLPDPQIIFLDELTAGIDPITRRALLDWILELHAQGKTIIYSTHNIFEAEQVCQEVGILNKGKLVALGDVNQLKKSYRANSLEDVFFKAVGYRK